MGCRLAIAAVCMMVEIAYKALAWGFVPRIEAVLAEQALDKVREYIEVDLAQELEQGKAAELERGMVEERE